MLCNVLVCVTSTVYTEFEAFQLVIKWTCMPLASGGDHWWGGGDCPQSWAWRSHRAALSRARKCQRELQHDASLWVAGFRFQDTSFRRAKIIIIRCATNINLHLINNVIISIKLIFIRTKHCNEWPVNSLLLYFVYTAALQKWLWGLKWLTSASAYLHSTRTIEGRVKRVMAFVI